MTVKSSNHTNRRCFALFFRTYISKIREELADEFKEFVTETDFDLFFRKAIMMYEGEL
jgi:succinate dehydrogenase flavin-adding protein (antitoxin of CptAB toxin-antitoxin module)